MRWHELTIHTTEEAAELISHHLMELGAGGVAIEESGTLQKQRDTSFGQWYEHALNDIPEGRAKVQAYFAKEEEMEEKLQHIQAKTKDLDQYGIDTTSTTFEVNIVDDEDWANAWKTYFKPIRVTDTITIKPTWETYDPSPGERIIELDPGMAFGTGTHETTALCIRVLESVVHQGDTVIDVGTGSGILAIAAAKLGADQVLAIDLDPVAVSSAKQNAALNGLDDKITAMESDLLGVLHLREGDESVAGQFGSANVVVANILAEIIVLFVDDVYRVLKTGGTYIASGIIKKRESFVKQALEKAGFKVERTVEEHDWIAIVARK